jgi:hypothetical protein
MKKLSSLLFLSMISFPAFSAVNCEISQYNVEAYDHGGVYIQGVLEGQASSWISICGGTTASPTEGWNCDDSATKNRLSIALVGQTTGRKLNAFFPTLNACSEFRPYMRPQGLKLK